MTFNKLKDVPEEKMETSTQAAAPWWATFTRPPARPSTVTAVTTSTAAPTAAPTAAHSLQEETGGHNTDSVTEPREDENQDDGEDDKVVFNTVRFQPVPGLEKSESKRRPVADTVGKLINVTGHRSNYKHRTIIIISFRRQCSH